MYFRDETKNLFLKTGQKNANEWFCSSKAIGSSADWLLPVRLQPESLARKYLSSFVGRLSQHCQTFSLRNTLLKIISTVYEDTRSDLLKTYIYLPMYFPIFLIYRGPICKSCPNALTDSWARRLYQ